MMTTISVLLLLLPGLAHGQERPAPAQHAFSDLQRAFTEANRSYYRKLNATLTSDEYRSLREKVKGGEDRDAQSKLQAMTAAITRPDLVDWTRKFMKGADKRLGSDSALAYLIWIVKNGRGKEVEVATDRIRDQHAASTRLADLMDSLRRLGWRVGHERARGLATAIIEKNRSQTIRGEAYYGRSQNYGTVKDRRQVLGDEDRQARASDIARCLELAPNSLSALRANARQFQKERLQLGMTAPDIVGKDLDGIAFKLSDYRGKVVVLDFWGDW